MLLILFLICFCPSFRVFLGVPDSPRYFYGRRFLVSFILLVVSASSLSLGTFLLRGLASTSIGVESVLIIVGDWVIKSISSSSSTGERVSISVAAVDISAVIAVLICVAIVIAIFEICDEMVIVSTNFISFMMSNRISRNKSSTSFTHWRGNGTGSFNTSLRLSIYPPSHCLPLPLIAPRPVFPPLPEGLKDWWTYVFGWSLSCSSAGVGSSVSIKVTSFGASRFVVGVYSLNCILRRLFESCVETGFSS